ncbi:MAG: class I SAM-dependent methyltransferase [Steroidobacteraceae bacterium]
MMQPKVKDFLAHRERAGRALKAQKSSAPQKSPTSRTIGDIYDDSARLASIRDARPRFMNLGYWEPDTGSTTEAQVALMAKLVEGILERSARATEPKQQKVLDVACGLGATTQYLSRRWPASAIHGINISEDQLEVCRRVAPGCTFVRMDAARLEFPDESFDHIVSVEAAFHFKTRKDFLSEARRVLKPGGVLALTDMLIVPESYEFFPKFATTVPRENDLGSIEEYEQSIRGSGFSRCDLRDITEEGWRRFFSFYTAHLHKEWAAGRLRYAALQQMLEFMYLMECTINKMVLCFALK